jgi:type IV secretion system protein VirB8
MREAGMKRDAVDVYLEEAASWDRDRVGAVHSSARRAWWVASGAVVTTLGAVGALALAMPLKRVEPYVIRVDNSSGVVDVVPAYAGKYQASEVVTRFLVSNYVMARERYVAAIAESDYDTVGAYNAAALNQRWAADWAVANPASPLNVYRDGTNVRVQVQAVSFLNRASGDNDLAQVRFLTATRVGAGGAESVRHYIATIHYAYGTPSSDEKRRALNPLGFKVVEYRRENEVVD